MQKLLTLLILILTLPLVHADIFKTGHHDIPVVNKITNIKDFPNMTLYTVAKESRVMCPIKLLSDDGKIPENYKFCTLSVYAEPKIGFSLDYLNTLSDRELEYHLKSDRVKEVLRNLQLHAEVANTDQRKEIIQEHTISLEETKEPEHINFYEPAYFFYFMLIVIALLVTFFIILKKMQKPKYG